MKTRTIKLTDQEIEALLTAASNSEWLSLPSRNMNAEGRAMKKDMKAAVRKLIRAGRGGK